MAGNASLLAAEKLRRTIFELAEDVFPEEIRKNLEKFKKKNPDYTPPNYDFNKESRRDRFELKDGHLFLKGAPPEPWMRLELGRFLRAIHYRNQGQMLTVEAFYDPPNELPDFEKGYGNISSTYVFGTQGAEVEVDTETGEVKVLHIAAAHEVGKVLNPEGLKGQIYGALAQGIGYALYEELQTQEGRILNPNFQDYKIPTIQEMDFLIDLDFIEIPDEFGPFGAKGIAEPGLVPTAPAIANAVYDAIGVRIRDLPITPEKVLAELKKLRT